MFKEYSVGREIARRQILRLTFYHPQRRTPASTEASA